MQGEAERTGTAHLGDVSGQILLSTTTCSEKTEDSYASMWQAPGQCWWQWAMAKERTCWCQSRQPWLSMGSEMWSAEGGMSRAAEAGFSATECSGWA